MIVRKRHAYAKGGEGGNNEAIIAVKRKRVVETVNVKGEVV